MIGYKDKIQEVAGRLLKDGQVDVVIGFKEGSVALTHEPALIRKAEDAKSLVWDSNCRLNLANYVTNRTDKIGIVAKGCDTRNLVSHIVENKIKRDQLVIIGVPCTGMVDKAKIKAKYDTDITSATDNGDSITVKGDGFEDTLAKADVIQDNCATCTHRNPVISDEMVAEPVTEQTDIDRFEDVRKIDAMSADEKWAFFEDMLSACTRCYACKNACPLCYCPTCFVDESKPQWVGKGNDPIDVRTYHFLRAYHCAGRCTDCGACEAACPMDIKVRKFTKKLDMECFEKYGWEAGLSLDQRPPLDAFKLDDPEAFIK